MYLRVKEIFALAADCQPSDPECVRFFQIMQNKLHCAATAQTAAELIAAGRADHTKPNMGLPSWKGAAVRKADVTIAPPLRIVPRLPRHTVYTEKRRSILRS